MWSPFLWDSENSRLLSHFFLPYWGSMLIGQLWMLENSEIPKKITAYPQVNCNFLLSFFEGQWWDMFNIAHSCLEIYLTSTVCSCHTFENNFEKNHELAHYLKKNWRSSSVELFSFKYFLNSVLVREISPNRQAVFAAVSINGLGCLESDFLGNILWIERYCYYFIFAPKMENC